MKTYFVMKTFLIAAAAVLGLAGTTYASTPTYAKGTPTMTAQQQKQAKVVRQLHELNQTEIAAGSLATQRGQTEAVRSYGQQLVADHIGLDSQVQRTATALNMTFAPFQSKEVDMLRKQPDSSFDDSFLALVIKEQTTVISQLQKARTEIKNEQVTALIDSTLPVVQRQLNAAQQLQANPSPAQMQYPQGNMEPPESDMQPQGQ